MINTFSPDPDREELDLLLRGFRVSGMLSRSLIYGSRTKSQPTATSRYRRLPIDAPFRPEPVGRVPWLLFEFSGSQRTAYRTLRGVRAAHATAANDFLRRTDVVCRHACQPRSAARRRGEASPLYIRR